VSWSAAQYVKFEDERTRPVRDLLAAVPTANAARAVDLGCGPGNSTAVLLERYPGAFVCGVDSSVDMLDEARRRLPAVAFEQADIVSWHPQATWDVILANAVLQWLPDHASLLPRLADLLTGDGSLAIQMPDNLREPSHVLMRAIGRSGPWAAKLASATEARPDLGTASWYYGLLRPACSRVDVWRTVYHHPLAGAAAIVEWFKGSALRPFLAPLADDEQEAFLLRYRVALAEAYPVQTDGTALLAFPRLFIVATR